MIDMTQIPITKEERAIALTHAERFHWARADELQSYEALCQQYEARLRDLERLKKVLVNMAELKHKRGCRGHRFDCTACLAQMALRFTPEFIAGFNALTGREALAAMASAKEGQHG